MEIKKVEKDKKRYISLLLLGDEDEKMIEKYLERGEMYIIDDSGVKGECVVTDEGNGILEIKNIAIAPKCQKKGYGRLLIEYITEKYSKKYSILQVGTGDSPATTPFYEKLGFQRHHIIENFFIDNYSKPIYECGVKLIHMVYLQKKIKKLKGKIMDYKFIKGDVFNEKNCYYAHCISRDYALGAGIAVEFDKRYNMREILLKLAKENPKTLEERCIEVSNVFNLITKKNYWEIPTYENLEKSLIEMREKIRKNKNIKKLVMPKIACGIDRLSWDRVEPMIKDIFKDLDIEIVVCYLE